MLQNPSKYHPNPLSHFLALHHHTQVAHAAGTQSTLAAASTGHHQHNLQEQHQQHHHQFPINNHHNHQHHLSQHSHTHLMDASSTLDAGKSFTIAAILGLQKSAIEHNCKDYNNVINLSLNNNNNNHHHHQITQNHKLENTAAALKNVSTGNGNCASGVQTFNCDTNSTFNNISRYLPSTNSNTSAATSFGANSTLQQQPQQQHSTNAVAAAHLRVNSFAAAAAVAAAAAANVNGGAPTALQSLQQLHQHHAQQSNLNFQRDKLKSDNNSKKSSLKNKRVRTIFTPEQLERLEAEFERQQYMVGPERLYLAHTLQLTEAQVKVWFQNRRIKWRKHHLEITQQRLALLRQSQMSATPGPNNRSTPLPACGEEVAEELKTNESCADMTSDSRQASESDLSICNDSNYAESFIDGDET